MEKFISINEWKKEKSERETFGCIMLDSKILDWDSMHTNGIDPKDVYIKPLDDSYGIEENPHMTILYGIHEDEVDPDTIMDVIREDMGQITVNITNISMFSNDEYDVVKYDVPVTEELKKYREMFERTFPNTQTFPVFHPHITLAYVKPGEGSKYVSELDEPFSVTFDKGVYSFHEEGEEESIRKEHVFPKSDDVEVNLDNEYGAEVTSPFTSDNE